MQRTIVMKENRITLGHGSGAGLTRELIRDVFHKNFQLPSLDDAVEIENRTVVTTDAYVVQPLFFPGGDIGKLAITGTINDLSMKGAVPRYILITFIIEEGFPVSDLKNVAQSIKKTAQTAKVRIIAGDTKVVQKGKADGLYITTTGVGFIKGDISIDPKKIVSGDKVIINGSIGDHSIAVLNKRQNLQLHPMPKSDCAPLNDLVQNMLKAGEIKFMRDPTRGGVATILNEVYEETKKGIIIEEDRFPIQKNITSVCELLGLDPLYLANEGKVLVIAKSPVKKLINKMKEHPLAKKTSIIGEITDEVKGVYVRTSIGGLRPLPLISSDPLPRIC